MSDTSIAATAETPAQMSDTFEVGEFRIGTVISKSFKIFFKNFFSFTLLALIVTSLPFILSLMYVGELGSGLDLSSTVSPETLPTVIIVLGIVSWVLGTLVTASITFGTYQHLTGRKASVGRLLSRGLPLIFPVLGVTIIVSLLVGVGMMLLVIPGLMIWTAYMVVIPATVVERLGIGASMKRSADLTRGFRWQVFGTYVLIAVISILFMMLIGGLIGGAIGFSGGEVSGLVAALIEFLSQGISMALFAVVLSVIYNELRVAKEGADVEQIASVFD